MPLRLRPLWMGKLFASCFIGIVGFSLLALPASRAAEPVAVDGGHYGVPSRHIPRLKQMTSTATFTSYLPRVANVWVSPVFYDWQPAMSPDGETIVFVRTYAGKKSDVYVMDRDGCNCRNLTQTPEASEDTPIFSPDGSTILYASDTAGQWDIYQLSALGGRGGSGTFMVPTPVISRSLSDELHPAVSPDGTTLAFTSNRLDGLWRVYTTSI